MPNKTQVSMLKILWNDKSHKWCKIANSVQFIQKNLELDAAPFINQLQIKIFSETKISFKLDKRLLNG